NAFNDVAVIYRNDCTAPRLAVTCRGALANRDGIGARIEVEGGPFPQHATIGAGGRYLSSDQPIPTFAGGTARGFKVWVQWPSGLQSMIENVQPNQHIEVTEPERVPGQQVRLSSPTNTPGTAWFVESHLSPEVTHHENEFDDFLRQPLLPRRMSRL